MSCDHLSFTNVTFSFNTSLDPVIKNITGDFHRGWTGITGANGAGKTTFLLLSCGNLSPVSGNIQRPSSVQYISQRTDYPPGEFTDFLCDPDGSVQRLISILEIGFDWPYRWDTLSHGERKRAQVGTALWKQPDLLALDEPTNHLDSNAGELVRQALSEYNGIGLLVSHDRSLMDSLCSQCLFLREDSWKLRPGGISRGLREEERERLEMVRELNKAQRQVKALSHESDARRRVAESQQRRRSKRGLAIKDHDARFKKNRARISGKDGTGGKLLRQMDGRIKQAVEQKESIKVPKKRHTGITVTTQSSGSDFLFKMENVRIPLDDIRSVFIRDLSLSPGQRIALMGPNGCGKTTLIRKILENITLSPEEYLYLPQEISEGESREIIKWLADLDNGTTGELLSQVSRLGSDPERLLTTALPSPGEVRKLLLARGFRQEPKLVILDEPTNHMDLPSMQCLEDCLSGLNCGMFIVSHDEVFIRRISARILEINPDETGNFKLAEIS